MYIAILLVLINLIGFQQEDKAKVIGYVYGEGIGITLDKARIVVENDDKIICQTESNEDGFYQLNNLSAGTYEMSVICEGFSKKWISFKLQEKERLYLDVGLEVGVTHGVGDKPTLKGTLTDTNGKPLQYVTLTVFNSFERQLTVKTVTDEKGQYKLGCDYGQIVIIVSKPGYSSKSLALDFFATSDFINKPFDFVLQKLDF